MEYMEHSNFYAMCDKIRKMEARELHLALEAHGGEFVWINDENDEEELYDPPIILVNLNDGPMDVVIHKVWLNDGCIELSAFDNEWGNQVDIELEDIVPGHLAYLIEYMPITDKVKSVATKIKKEAQKTEAEVKNFFEEMRRCRKHIDSLNQYRQQCEMDLFSLKGCRYDKEPVNGGSPSDLSDIVIAFKEKMAKSEELRIKELNRYKLDS